MCLHVEHALWQREATQCKIMGVLTSKTGTFQQQKTPLESNVKPAAMFMCVPKQQSHHFAHLTN